MKTPVGNDGEASTCTVEKVGFRKEFAHGFVRLGDAGFIGLKIRCSKDRKDVRVRLPPSAQLLISMLPRSFLTHRAVVQAPRK